MMGKGAAGLALFADSVWIASTPVRFAGTWFPHVMAVVRLRDGSLLLHSPCRPSDDLLQDIASLGNVAHVVAPNWFHDLYLAEYRAIYRDATFWAPRFLQRQRKRIIDCALNEGVGAPWCGELPYVALRGLWSFDECVFFHVASRTLIVADLLMNVFATKESPYISRFAARLFHLDGTLRVFPLIRWLRDRNRGALRAVMHQIMEWNPERLIVGHGHGVSDNVAPQLRVAFNWLQAR
jgi:hypothetical protein